MDRLILSASAAIRPKLVNKILGMEIDLKPALSFEQLDARLLRDFEEAKNKRFKNAVDHLFPAKMIPVMLELSKISPEKKVNEVTREERQGFARLIKAFPVTLNGVRDFKEAIITRGGVKVKEINPSTMESRLVGNLYFCGEVLDLDAMTGGYNLQIAWSTGYLAGSTDFIEKEGSRMSMNIAIDGTCGRGKEYDCKASCKGAWVYLC